MDDDLTVPGWEDLSRAPHHPARKVFIGAIHATLTLQKKYGYAGWFRIQGFLEQDYGIHLSPTTIKKIMALNRRVHLAPQRPAAVVEVRDLREGPKKSRYPFERIFVDLRYLDAKPGGAFRGLTSSSRSGMANLEPNTSHNCWSNINVSGANGPLVRPPSRSLSTMLTLSNRGRRRCLIRSGVVKDQERNDQPPSS